MLRHVVMFQFKEEAEGRSKAENVAITKAMLEALPEKISWIRSSTVAVNAPDADEGNFDLVLITDFPCLSPDTPRPSGFRSCPAISQPCDFSCIT